MKKEYKSSAITLRQQAESLANKNPSKNLEQNSEFEIKKLIHELEVHQIELQLQNEELMRARNEALETSEKFSDLYNFAPSGYFTLNNKSEIIELNLYESTLLGMPSSLLRNQKFGVFVTDETKPIFNIFLDKVFKSKKKETCELTLSVKSGLPIYVFLSGFVPENTDYCLVTMLDITERRLAEDALIEKKVQYQNLANPGLALIWTSDTNKLCNYFNDPWLEFTGRTLEQEIGNGWAESVHPEDLDHCVKTYETAFEKREAFEMEYRLRHSSGAFRWILDMGIPNYNSSGQFIGYIGNCIDITSRKLAEEKERQNSQKIESILESISDAFVSLDTNWCYTYMNKKAGEIFNRDPNGMIGKHIWTEFPEDVGEKFYHACYQAVETQKFQYIEEQYKPYDFWFENKIYPSKEGLSIFFHDITGRKQIEQKLHESEEKFRNVFEQSVVGKSITTVDGKMKINNAFSRIVGYTQDELLNISWQEITYKDDIELNIRIVDSILKGEKESDRWEKRYIHKNGNIVWVDISTTLLRDKTGNPLYFITVLNDITGRKLVDEKLRKNFDLLNKLTDQVPGVVYQYRLYPDGHSAFPYSSRGMYDIYEVTPEEVKTDASPIFTRLHPDDINAVVETINESARNLAVYHSEFRVLLPKQGLRWRKCDAKPERLEDGSTLWYGIISDITEKKEAEIAIRESNERLNLILENNPIAIWDWNIKNDKWYATPQYYKMLGYVPGSDYPEREVWMNAIHTDDRELVKSEIESVLLRAEEEYNYDARILHADGSYRWQTVIGHVIDHDETGKAIRMLGVSIDIDERKQIEEKLYESEKKLSTLFATMTEMVVLHELVFNERGEAVNYRITDCNNAFTLNLGIKKELAVGKLATEIYQSETPPFLDIYSKVGMTGESHEFNTYYAPLDKYFMISVVSPEKNHFATITNDISNIKQIQEALTSKNKELENYLYVASHDLRSPLVNIQGFSQRFQRQAEAIKSLLDECIPASSGRQSIDKITNEDIPKTMNFILSNVSKMDNLLNGLLQISRTGRLLMIIKRVNMNQLIQTIVAGYNFEITELSAKVFVNDLSDCYGDENQLNQLFSNLISNALKYSDPSRQLIIEVSSRVQYNRVIYAVKDTGMGINAKHLVKIWDVFYRIDSASATAGDGIGLNIAKRIADKHKGKVWAESEEEKGSAFFVELHKNEFAE